MNLLYAGILCYTRSALVLCKRRTLQRDRWICRSISRDMLVRTCPSQICFVSSNRRICMHNGSNSNTPAHIRFAPRPQGGVMWLQVISSLTRDVVSHYMLGPCSAHCVVSTNRHHQVRGSFITSHHQCRSPVSQLIDELVSDTGDLQLCHLSAETGPRKSDILYLWHCGGQC